MCDERDPPAGSVVPPDERHPEDRSGRRPERPRTDGIGAAGRESDSGPEGVRRTQERPDVARVTDLPERERDLPRAGRQVVSAEDGDDTWRVPEGRHLAEELGTDILARDETLDGLDARGQRSLDEVLTLGCEEPGLVPVLRRREKLPD